jgi:hypothetical protein
VVSVNYVDAYLYHDMLKGRSVSGILHICNQNVDLRFNLRYLGVHYKGQSFMFGDNQALVNYSAIPHLCLSK